MAFLPYPRSPPNSFHRTHSKFVCTSPPTEFTEYTEASGGGYSPTDFTEYTEASGGEYPPTDFTDVHRSFWRRRASHRCDRCTQMVRLRRVLPRNSQNTQKLLAENSLPQMRTDAHRWLGCVGFSHGIHRIHRSFWRRIFSHGFHRCTQIFLLRQSFLCVPRILWEDSLVAAWVWQGCHTLLICAYLCNLWENILRQKLLWVL